MRKTLRERRSFIFDGASPSINLLIYKLRKCRIRSSTKTFDFIFDILCLQISSLFPRKISISSDHSALTNCWSPRGIQGHWPSSSYSYYIDPTIGIIQKAWQFDLSWVDQHFFIDATPQQILYPDTSLIARALLRINHSLYEQIQLAQCDSKNAIRFLYLYFLLSENERVLITQNHCITDLSFYVLQKDMF